MAHYQTAQKKKLIEFLTSNREKAFSVEELDLQLKSTAEGEAAPGKSTLYRLIRSLVDEGLVKRLVKGNSRQFIYQIAGEECAYHLHMKCVECGRLIHMEHGESLKLLEEIFHKNHFKVDERQTVLMGKCDGCRVE